MDHTRKDVRAKLFAGVPETVFLLAGVNRLRAKEIGMVGCGLQLNESNSEFDWRETTISLDITNPYVCIFLKTEEIPFSLLPGRSSHTRVPLLTFEKYSVEYPRIHSFMECFRNHRFLRLGSRAYLAPHELDSRDSFMLRLSDEEFKSFFITDPRGPPSMAEIARGIPRHPPKLFRSLPGLPAPGQGSWI